MEIQQNTQCNILPFPFWTKAVDLHLRRLMTSSFVKPCTEIFCYKKANSNTLVLLDPSFWSLYGEQRDHGNGTIVVVEGSPPPLPLHYVRGSVVIQVVDKIFTPGTNIWISFSIFQYLYWTYWQASALSMDASLQKKNFPLKSWTPTMAKMRRKRR